MPVGIAVDHGTDQRPSSGTPILPGPLGFLLYTAAIAGMQTIANAHRVGRRGSVFRQVIEYFFQRSVQFCDLGFGQAFETGAEDIAGAVLDFFNGMAADIGE